ncbi:holo-ACP synthase [Evansella halocellulosilytica]|uniref:holo-ACP synthase n=1 Tax=Evansella halocellulosilytica TaxID=2011013 RepID=UPI000BB90DEC|nr:holo-ACP synthase [Evansella halocellulosilytica]
MIIGVGLDIIELNRIENLAKRQQKFAQRILSKTEMNKYESLVGNRKIEYLAGRFAAKEAVSKALGCGIGKNLSFQDVEVVNNGIGRPVMKVNKGEFKQINIHLSITHTKSYAAAQVVLESFS